MVQCRVPSYPKNIAPTWLLVMRHAKAKPAGHRSGQTTTPVDPAAVLDATGLNETDQVGDALAETLDDLARTGTRVHVARVVHEDSAAAAATAEALATAYKKTAGALAADYDERPDPLGARERWFRGLSGQATAAEVKVWLTEMEGRLTEPVRTELEQAAVLLVGHEPGMSRLVSHLQGRRLFRRPDVPALARAELLALRRHGKRWQPLWALTPRPKDDPAAQDDIGAITAKIKSKMDTAKVFGPFLTALLTFVATQFASTPTQSPFWWPMVRGVSLAALGVAAVFYFMTLFWYDRLLMPTRFWSGARPRRDDEPAVVMRRPPSSAVWVLYQNMQRTWRLLFVPATYATGVGIVAFAAARIEPEGDGVWILVAVVLLAALGGLWGWLMRPVLGVQD